MLPLVQASEIDNSCDFIIDYLQIKHCLKQNRQRTYKHNIEVRSRKQCWHGKAIGVTYSECVFVALDIQHAIRMGHIVICVLSASTILFHITLRAARFSKKKIIEYKTCFYFIYNFV